MHSLPQRNGSASIARLSFWFHRIFGPNVCPHRRRVNAIDTGAVFSIISRVSTRAFATTIPEALTYSYCAGKRFRCRKEVQEHTNLLTLLPWLNRV